MAQELTPRGTTVCRGCGGGGLVSVLDLGLQPLANELPPSRDTPDPRFPLHLKMCPVCGLGQVGEYVLPERIFGQDYPYLSSMSTTWLEHASRYAATMRETLDLTPGDLVVEIASNDGYLLEQFVGMGVPVLGVEPAGAVAEIARGRGVRTRSEFFGDALAREIRDELGHPRLIAANNVMAHVPDLVDFVSGIATLCDDRTVVTIENPSLVNLLLHTQFDTIYHEHFSYLTAHAVSRVAESCGLRLVRVEELATHGGSNRYWLVAADSPMAADESVDALIARELESGLLDPEVWEAFAGRASGIIEGLRSWLDERRKVGRRVAGYGAAAKGNTLMNAAGVAEGDLLVVVDESPAKQGRYLPGSHVPVEAPDGLSSHEPDDVLILPWNLAPEITPILEGLVPTASCWTAVPAMQRVDGGPPR